jgi:hypothetical protein
MKPVSSFFRRARPQRLSRSHRPYLETLETRDLLSGCTVDRLTDNNPAGGGKGGNGMGDLRWCVVESLFRADTIDFSTVGTINLAAALPALTRSVSIDGPGADLLTVRRGSGGNYRIFTVASGVTATISGLTITGGNTSDPPDAGGGGIRNSGTLTINNTVISGNTAIPGIGGGILNDGMLTINNSAISGGNYASLGGGIANNGTLVVSNSSVSANPAGNGAGVLNNGTATFINSTISGNVAENQAGGIINRNVLTISNSIIAGNRAQGIGGAGHTGGISNEVGATLTITSSTITGNSAIGIGGGIAVNSPSQIAIRNTIIAGNTASAGQDIYGNMGSQGYNLLGNPVDASGWTDTDILHVNAMLGPLQDNGGPTQTMALLLGSPALNAGDPAQLGVPDQRGVVRTGGVNIGAYQASATAFVLTAPAKVTAGVPFDMTVTAVDPFRQLALGYRGTVHFTTSDPQLMNLPDYTFTASDNGVHAFNVTLKTAGSQTVTVTDPSGPSFLTGSATVTVNPAAASVLTVSAFPSPTVAGTAQTFTITAQDAYGNVATGYCGTVRLTSSDPQAVFPTATYTFTAADNGVHTFAAELRTAGTQSITATDTTTGTIVGMQTGIQVAADVAARLAVTAPSSVTAGQAFNLTVSAFDRFNNLAAGYRGTVTFSTTDPDPGIVLPADYTFTADDAGVHTFTDTGLGETTLFRHGHQVITATDTADGSVTGQATVKVKRAHEGQHWSGDINRGLPGGQEQDALAAAHRSKPMDHADVAVLDRAFVDLDAP